MIIYRRRDSLKLNSQAPNKSSNIIEKYNRKKHDV